MTDDAEAAKKFYKEVIGWEMRDEQMPNGTYTVINVDGEEVGGIMNKPPEAAQVPLVYLLPLLTIFHIRSL